MKKFIPEKNLIVAINVKSVLLEEASLLAMKKVMLADQKNDQIFH